MIRVIININKDKFFYKFFNFRSEKNEKNIYMKIF